MRYARRWVLGESADMKFVDDRARKRRVQSSVQAPIKIAVYNDGSKGALLILSAPFPMPAGRECVWIDQDSASIKAKALGKFVGKSIEAKSVFDTGIEPFQKYMPDISGSIENRIQWIFHSRLFSSGVEKDKRGRGGALRYDRKADPISQYSRAEGQGAARVNLKRVRDQR